MHACACIHAMQKQLCFNHRVVTLHGCRQTEETVVESVTLVLKSNCTRQPKGQFPSSSYNHNTLKTLITSFSGYMKVPYCNFEAHL